MRFVREDEVRSAPAASERFTDGVWQADILPARHEGGMRAVRFVYRPGSRSAWHTHDGEQAIIVVAGQGVVTRWGEAKGTVVGPGDWVHVEPGEKHWHGARPDNVFVHVAVNASGGTQWHEPVAEDEYRASVDPATQSGGGT